MNRALQPAFAALSSILLGKEQPLKLALACLLARGHLLIEDVPGVGKTTLALALARVFGLQSQRIQFTSDLLPSDLLGVSIYEAASGAFRFHPGPVFAQLVLADELNRASPKTQSALLEAMAERQVTHEGQTRPLPAPFFVIATQNPGDQAGTYPLPESQLDRFLMRISLGYPPASAERALLGEADRRDLLAALRPVFDAGQLEDLQRSVRAIHTSPALVDYLMALIEATRSRQGLRHGLSPRAGIALRSAAQAWACIEGRSGVIPEDVQAVFVAVCGHRLARTDGGHGLAAAAAVLAEVPVP